MIDTSIDGGSWHGIFGWFARWRDWFQGLEQQINYLFHCGGVARCLRGHIDTIDRGANRCLEQSATVTFAYFERKCILVVVKHFVY